MILNLHFNLKKICPPLWFVVFCLFWVFDFLAYFANLAPRVTI